MTRRSAIMSCRELLQAGAVAMIGTQPAASRAVGFRSAQGGGRSGELPWTRLDGLHRMILDTILIDFGIRGLSEAETDALNRAWHRLRPWPDAVAGLTRLKKKFIIAPLSNGNISLMTDLARHSKLPWDCILGPNWFVTSP